MPGYFAPKRPQQLSLRVVARLIAQAVRQKGASKPQPN
jgi:hypothetical protein